MIGMVYRLRSFTRLAHYLGGEDGSRAAWSQYRNLAFADNLPQAAREMGLVARRSERVEKPVLHLSISWAPEDDPSKWQMSDVVDSMLRDLELADHQATFVGHTEKAYAHTHVMANRVHPDSGIVRTDWRYPHRIQANLRRAERTYGFTETPGHLFRLEGQKRPDRSQSISSRAYRTAIAQGKLPFQLLVREVAEKDFDESRSWEELSARLARHGLRLVPRRGGLVVTDGHEYAKSSSIAPDVSRKNLETRFGKPFEMCTTPSDRAPQRRRNDHAPRRRVREKARGA